jgi:copper chaperone CopZ
MKTLMNSIVVVCITLLTTNLSVAQTKNIQIVNVKVYGNCGMCKKTIEKAGNVKGKSKTEWNVETAMAKITIDSTKTSVDEVLKRIAAVGYDSDKFKASDEVYENLHGCCQYDRPVKKNK